MQPSQFLSLRGTRQRPSIFDKDFLFLNALSREMARAAGELPDTGLTILDIGSATKPYRGYFEGKYRHFIGIDLPPLSQGVDVAAAAECLPIATGTADVCVCTQVLEHVQRPELVIAELARVLKPGGVLLLSTHGVYHHHPFPTDYWRWTHEGLRKIHDAHFHVTEVRPNGGTMMLMFHILGRGVFHRAEHRRGFRFLQYTVYPVINVVGLALGSLIRESSLTVNYLVVARKRATAAAGAGEILAELPAEMQAAA